LQPEWKGLDTGRTPVFIGYDQTERMLLTLLERAAKWERQWVVGITRGGLIPATMAASILALPLAILSFERATGVVRWVGEASRARRILLVDDSCSTGATMRQARSYLVEQGYECLTLTVVHDPEVSAFVPDLSHPMTVLFRMPWERGEATPAARAQRASGDKSERRLCEAPYVGLDLDGVFLPETPRAAYAADLEGTLLRRHALAPCTVLPSFAPERAVIITGRPLLDEARTREWLARCGHGGLPIEFRPADVSPEPVAVAGYKARAATRRGCTHFVESEAEQAIRIAALAPHLIVSWWSAEEARAWLVGAATGGEAGGHEDISRCGQHDPR
jgi:adenine/guanine phosphoribosyltransferase-like PRPP-binding protein